jgi:hypothetical protein
MDHQAHRHRPDVHQARAHLCSQPASRTSHATVKNSEHSLHKARLELLHKVVDYGSSERLMVRQLLLLRAQRRKLDAQSSTRSGRRRRGSPWRSSTRPRGRSSRCSSTAQRVQGRARLYIHGAALHVFCPFVQKKTRLILDARPVDAVRGHPSLVELRLQHSRHKKINVIKN